MMTTTQNPSVTGYAGQTNTNVTGTTDQWGQRSEQWGQRSGGVFGQVGDPYSSTKVYEFNLVTPRYENTVDYVETVPLGARVYQKHGARPLLNLLSSMGTTKVLHITEWESFNKRVEARLALFHDDEYRVLRNQHGSYISNVEAYLTKPLYYPVQIPTTESRILIRRIDFKGKPSVTAERFKIANDAAMPVYNQYGLKFIGLFKPIFAEKSNCLIVAWEVPASVDPDVVRQVFLKTHQDPSTAVKEDKLWENITAVSNRLYVPAPVKHY